MNRLVFSNGSPKYFHAEAQELSPEIEFDGNTGMLRIHGMSLPENPMDVYSPVMEWLEQYVKEPADNTELTLALMYYNTSTSKILFSVIHVLEELHRLGKPVMVKWYYNPDDADMEEAGRDFAATTVLSFVCVESEMDE